jgi:endonuclease G
MKFVLAFLLLFLTQPKSKQEVVTIKRDQYTSHFSTKLRYPVLVEWWVTKAKVICNNPIPRKDKFQPDPSLPKETNLVGSYAKSGYDRGHMSPAADNQCSGEKAMIECFYFSNMAPQTHSLNAGDWKSLETWTRKTAEKMDSIKVWAGNIGEQKKIGQVSVPTQCWKVVYVKRAKLWKAYIFKNDSSKQDGIENNEVAVAEVEKLTGFKFQ